MSYKRGLVYVLAALSLIIDGFCCAPGLAAQKRQVPDKPGASTQQSSAYLKLVKAKLEHHFSPASAANAHATITFRISKDGKIFWMELTDASGTSAVNQAAEDAISSCSPMPALPNGVDHLDVSASFDSNVENSTKVHYSRPSPDRVKDARKLAADATKDMASKRYMTAVENLQKALLLTPFDASLKDKAVEAYVTAAKNYKEDEEYSKQLLHEALLIDPQNESTRGTLNELWKIKEEGGLPFDGHLKLAREYKMNGKPVDALAEYGEAWRLKQDPTLISEINAVCRLQEAYRSLEKWKSIAETSRTAENLQVVAKAYAQCGDLSNAKTFYEAALGLDPNFESARKGLTDLSQSLPQTANAAADTQLSDIFPYVGSGSKAIKLQEVKNRQVSVDYMQWACSGNAVHRWTPGKFPLRLYVESGAGVPGWRPQCNKMVADALAAWCQASENRITFVQVNDRRGANITCKWTAKPEQISIANAQGVTDFQFMSWGGPKGSTGNDTICKGDITILTIGRGSEEVLPDIMMKEVCLHEIGHALGIAGHSPYPRDVMHPQINFSGVVTKLSAQDKNTIKRLYQGYEHPAK